MDFVQCEHIISHIMIFHIVILILQYFLKVLVLLQQHQQIIVLDTVIVLMKKWMIIQEQILKIYGIKIINQVGGPTFYIF